MRLVYTSPVLDKLYQGFVVYPRQLILRIFGILVSFVGMFGSAVSYRYFFGEHYTPHIDWAFLSVEHIMRDARMVGYCVTFMQMAPHFFL